MAARTAFIYVAVSKERQVIEFSGRAELDNRSPFAILYFVKRTKKYWTYRAVKLSALGINADALVGEIRTATEDL